MNQLSYDEIALLVVKAQAGDQSAFAMIYTATVQQQLYFATSFLKDSILAEDVVQEVYLSLYKALPKLQNPRTLVAYLNRITYNTCVDYKRKQYKEKYELNEEALTTMADSAPNATPEDYFEHQLQSSELYQALEQIDEDYRSAFLMRYYQNMKIKEIALAMNLSESTVKRYIKAASKALTRILHSGSLFERGLTS